MQVVWLTRNEALHGGGIIYGAGLPVQKLKTYLLEALRVDVEMADNSILDRLLHQLDM